MESIIEGIKPLDLVAVEAAKRRVDSLAKPLGSLGTLEEIAIKLAGITGELYNKVDKKCVIIMSSDNGVVEEGVASAPQYVTLEQTKNFIKGKTGVAAISKANNTELMVIDVGINSNEKIYGVLDRKINKGTKNIFKEEAMTYDEAKKAINIGIEAVAKAKNDNYDIIGVGEMGIGNTTTSAAVLMVLTGCDLEDVVGKGAGITKEAFEKKKLVVKTAVYDKSIDKNDPVDVVSKVGGYDIAAMAGVFLGAAFYRVPVVIDGFISAVAALVATKINPLVKDFCISSHKSEEIGYNIAIKELNLNPMLNLGMRLGEGSGCPIAFSIVEFAISMMNNMATFEEGNIDDEYLDEIRGEENYKI